MNTPQDHPDIEKLPLEIDGIPVRETIRAVFRNPEHGKPDNISKKGCLELALKSNQVARALGVFESDDERKEGRGHVVWNAWRSLFPVIKNFSLYNFADFSECNFSSAPDFRFSRFHFGSDANFEGCTFSYGYFSWCVFGSGANFSRTQFNKEAHFNFSRFEQGNFQRAIFGDSNQDLKGLAASFAGASFCDHIDFGGVKFFGRALFAGVDSDLLPSRFPIDGDEQMMRFRNSFMTLNFANAAFYSDANFDNRRFRWRSIFREVEFSAPPKFHGCEFHQDISFEDANFPPATGSEEAVRAYRTLKLAFSKQQAIREEQRFFRLEMAEETLRETGVKRWFFKAYQVVSDYGFSVVRPMAYLVALPFGWLMVLYACLSLFSLVPTGAFDEGGFSTTWSSQLLRWSLSNAIPIPGVEIAGKLRPALFGDGYLSVIALVLEIIQKLLSLTALFLSGLALRNLFKIK